MSNSIKEFKKEINYIYGEVIDEASYKQLVNPEIEDDKIDTHVSSDESSMEQRTDSISADVATQSMSRKTRSLTHGIEKESCSLKKDVETRILSQDIENATRSVSYDAEKATRSLCTDVAHDNITNIDVDVKTDETVIEQKSNSDNVLPLIDMELPSIDCEPKTSAVKRNMSIVHG